MLIAKRTVQRVGIRFEQQTPDSLAKDLRRLVPER
jgi:hypothetical protein